MCNTADLTKVRQILAILDVLPLLYPYLVNTADKTTRNTWQANDVQRVLDNENDNVQFPVAD